MTAQKKKDKVTKQRQSKYEPKVKFEGTFEDIIKVSTIGARTKMKDVKNANKNSFTKSKDKNINNPEKK